MNHMRLEEMLTDIEGIEKAVFHERKREITVVYDDSKITVPEIIKSVVKITQVDEDIILLPGEK